MPKHIQLTIADPCHEDWDKMTTVQQGRFCGACQKQVVDFTGMSDAQLVAFFKKKTDGSVCGRFFNDQLDKDIPVPKKRIPWVKYFFQLTLPLFLTSLKSGAQKGKVIIKRTKTETVCTISPPGLSGPDNEVKGIRGIVKDEKGSPVSYVSVSIKGTKFGMAADSTGAFSLKSIGKNKDMTLVFSCIGFATQELIVPYKDILEGMPVIIELKPKTELPEAIVVSYATMGKLMMTGSVTRVKRIIEERKKTSSVIPPVFVPALKLYPNPLPSGTAVNMECKNMEEGYYSFQFLNMAGQLIVQKEVWIDKGAGVLNMPVPSVAAGTYFIRMENKKSAKKFTDKLVIQ